MKQTNTVDDFITAWESITGNSPTVYILCHCNGQSLIFQNNDGISIHGYKLNGEPSGGKISELKAVSINELYLLCCNSGDVMQASLMKTNVAKEFLRIGSINTVYAFDGSVGFGGIFGGYRARLAWDQASFHDLFYTLYGKSNMLQQMRSPLGLVCYCKEK